MSTLLWLAAVVFLVWLLGFVVFKVASVAFHLLLVAALVMAVMWLVKRTKHIPATRA